MPQTDTMPTDALDLLTAPGPFATVHLPTPSALADAAERFESSLKVARDRLEDLGASGELIGRVRDEAHGSGHQGGESLVVVANAGDAWSWVLQDEIEQVTAELGPLPHIARLVESTRRSVPHVVVLIDREGADIEVVHRGTDPETTMTVVGDTDVIHRGAAGGWSQRRFQQRAENTWEENARDVADAVSELFPTVRPHAVLVAGDERAVGFFVEHLSEEAHEVVHRLEHGGRADGADLDGMRADVDRHLADLVARRTTDLLERFASHRANGAAVEGAPDTLGALFEHRVETLLVHADPDDDRTAYFGPDAGQVSVDRETFASLDIDAEEGPLLEVALRGAHGTGAEIWFVPEHGPAAPAGGIGAILRG